ncbi:MAG: hypothetical protein Q9191_000967 [Dirinaria sp. TL-2023a]
MGPSDVVTHEVDNQRYDEARFLVHEGFVHLSPILKERCCGSLCDPEEPSVIRLSADNPDHFSQMLEALYMKKLPVRIDPGHAPYNWLTTACTTPEPSTTNGEVPEITRAQTRELSEATAWRSQCAVTNLSQVYCLAQKYELNEVQALALKRLTYYVNPTDFPDGFLWQVAMIYEEKPGASQILEPYLQKAIDRIKNRGEEGDEHLQPYIQRGDAFGSLVWQGYCGKHQSL